MSNAMKPGAVVFAKDLGRLARFYEAILGMTPVHTDDAHVVLGSPTFLVVIHAIPKHIADSFEITMPPERRTDTPIKLFFPVDSIAGVRARAAALGGGFNPPEMEWSGNGFRACDGHDPEGNVLQIRESMP